MPSIVIISDTHGHHSQVVVPQADILIHCGDFSEDQGQAAYRSFFSWLEGQPHKWKILIAGNHELALEKWPDLVRAMMKEICPSVIYLQDSGVTIEGLNIYGSPVQPEFYSWAFNRKRGAEIKRHWDMIPDDTNILITHGPARGFNDYSPYGKEHVGCDDLLEAIKRVRPSCHVFGHVHNGYGVTDLIHDNKSKTMMINASICNERYEPMNKPWVINL